GDAAFDGKEHDAEKPESGINLSPSSSALSGEQDDMTKKKDKGKSPNPYCSRDLACKFLENKPNIAGTGPTWKTREEANQQYILFPMWSTGSLNPQNKKGDAAFDGKEHDAEKPESGINLSPSSSALSGEQDDMTKKKDKGKSPVGY
nr:hypothetical protein [Tanacetum cinerariifolium]